MGTPITQANQSVFAVQPASWKNFDQHGCTWAENMANAYSLAKLWVKDEQQAAMIWCVPLSGVAYRWLRYSGDAPII
jgi:hypothetical protein